jgi:hypothetical protein
VSSNTLDCGIANQQIAGPQLLGELPGGEYIIGWEHGVAVFAERAQDLVNGFSILIGHDDAPMGLGRDPIMGLHWWTPRSQ